MAQTLEDFGKLFGLQMNKDKFEIKFSNNTPRRLARMMSKRIN